jgi:hypothetical protein
MDKSTLFKLLPVAPLIRNHLVAFFQAVKARLIKFNSTGSGHSDEEIETTTVDRSVLFHPIREYNCQFS